MDEGGAGCRGIYQKSVTLLGWRLSSSYLYLLRQQTQRQWLSSDSLSLSSLCVEVEVFLLNVHYSTASAGYDVVAFFFYCTRRDGSKWDRGLAWTMRVGLARGHGCFRLLIVKFFLCYATHMLNDATLCDVYMLCAVTFCSNIVAWLGERGRAGGC